MSLIVLSKILMYWVNIDIDSCEHQNSYRKSIFSKISYGSLKSSIMTTLVLNNVFMLFRECVCLQCLPDRGGGNQWLFLRFLWLFKGFFVCNRTASKLHRNPVGQDALACCSVKTHQQLLAETFFPEDPQEAEALLCLFHSCWVLMTRLLTERHSNRLWTSCL